MVVRAMLAVLLIHVWMDGVSAAEVPSKFVGLWEGSAVSSDGTSWKVSTGITGGSSNSTVAVMNLMSSREVCWHQIKLPEKEGKNVKKKSVEDDMFTGETVKTFSLRSFFKCPRGEFTFESNRLERLVVVAQFMDEETGAVTDEFSFVLTRIDDASSAKVPKDTCKSKSKPSPLAKLRSKLSCEKASRKGL